MVRHYICNIKKEGYQMQIYVNAKARCDGDGSKERPFKRINDAAKIAMPGDEVLVLPGVYREYVNPIHSGTAENRIVYRSVEPLGAIISGAEEVKNWKHFCQDIWVTHIPNGVFNDYNPYNTPVYGDWYFAKDERHTGCVYLNDKAMYEALTLTECDHAPVYEPSWEHEWTRYKWYAECERDETVIYANFQGKDPREEKVEINVRRECFMPSEEHVDFITLSGFYIEKAATTWAPPAAYQDGMVGPHWAYGWIIEDCEIVNSKCCGISLGKYYDAENDHYFTRKHVKSATQMERDAVCRGQYHGWLKEKVGSHIIRRCNIHDCQQTGIVGRMGCVFSTIEDNHIHHINNMMELGGAEISAIKLHAAIDVVIRRNHIHHSTMGIWLDWEAQGARVSQNLLHDNDVPEGSTKLEGGMESQDIFVEVGHGPTLIDNNIMLSRYGLRVATEGVAMVHNLILGAFTMVGSGVDNWVDGREQRRYTPYHIRHRTEVAGMMTILHGDNRFYNNIFVQGHPITNEESKESPFYQQVGTHVWDEYPTYKEWIAKFDMEEEKPDMGKLEPAHFSHLPVWADGNVYLAGAKAWKKEKHNLVKDDADVQIELLEEDGQYRLSTNLYDYLDGFTTGIINSDVLGKAFEPEQRFEERDGSDIVFQSDYLGNHRGVSTIPGPFADVKELDEVIWID
jgi:alpha-N-arabinofuranosidase